MTEPEGEKTRATVYKERTSARTWLEQYFALKAEALEENNTENARFQDLSALLAHLLSGVLSEIATLKDGQAYQKRADDLLVAAGALAFDGKWVNNGKAQGMTHKEAAAWAYMKMNAVLRVNVVKAEALALELRIIPRETYGEAEDRFELEAIIRPKIR